MGNGGCSQFITVCLRCFFILMFFPYSSVGLLEQDAVLIWFNVGPSKVLQFKNHPSVDLYHGVQSFSNRQLQFRLPTVCTS